MGHARFLSATCQRQMHFVRDLGREIVKRQGGNEADHARRNPGRYCHEVRSAKGGATCEAIDSAAHPLQYPTDPHCIARSGMDSGVKGVRCSVQSAMFL